VYADGGVGKTALAVELGWRPFEARQFDFVLFLNASTPETLDALTSALACEISRSFGLSMADRSQHCTKSLIF
jgi:hypothetical protein